MTDHDRRTADVVIIGGGIVGCLTAWSLAKDGVSVILLEKGEIGGEQSSRNWGYIRQQARAAAEIPLMVQANRSWTDFEDLFGAPIGWRQRGNLRLIARQSEMSWYEDWAVLGRKHGVPTELLSSDEISRLLPGAQGRWIGAMFTATDGQVDPAAATRAARGAAERVGARVYPHIQATEILVANGRVVGVGTPHAVISTSTVIAATGVWTRRLLSPLGINLPLQWVRSTVAETAAVPDFPDIPAVWSPGVAFRKTDAGTILFASSGHADVDAMPSALNNMRSFLPALTHNLRAFQLKAGRPAIRDTRNMLMRDYRFHGWEPKANSRAVRKARSALADIYPATGVIPTGRQWAGYIDGTPDNLPVLSLVDSVEGLVVGAGFSGHGFGLAPSSASVLRDLALRRKCEDFDISAFDLGRFSDPEFEPIVSVAH